MLSCANNGLMPTASLLCSNLYLLLSVGKCHKLDVLNTQKSAHLFGHAKAYSPISFNLTNLKGLHLHMTRKCHREHLCASCHGIHKPGLCSLQNFNDFREAEMLSTLMPAANLTIYVYEINSTEFVYIETDGPKLWSSLLQHMFVT